MGAETESGSRGDNPNSSRNAGIAGPYSAWSAPMSTNPTQEATTAAGLKTGVRAGASVEDMGNDVTGNIRAVKIRGQKTESAERLDWWSSGWIASLGRLAEWRV